MTTVFDSLLLGAIAATLLALLVWGAGWIPAVRRRPGLRQFLWVIVLVKLVTPPLFEWPVLPARSAGVSNRGPQTGTDLSPARMIPARIAGQPEFAVDAGNLPVIRESARGRTAIPGAKALHPARTESALLEPENRPVIPFPWRLTLLGISIAGTFVVLVIVVRQSCGLRQALRQSQTCDARLTRIAGEAATAMGLPMPPEVCVASAGIPPLLWMRRSGPLVVLPRRLADELSDEQLRCVVSHEIAHYLRRDHWTNLLSLLAVAVFWWHPVVWWARRELRAAQEACCDAMVINRLSAPRRVYAGTLLHALEFLQSERPLLPSLASGFGGKSSTQRRFEMIANPHVNHRLSWWSYPVLLAALAALPCLPTRGLAQKGDRAGEIRGVVQSVDPAKGTVTVLTKKGGATAYQVPNDAKVLLDNGGGKDGFREGKLTDLAEGLAVTLQLAADKRVSRIKAEGPTVKGTLKSVDAGNRKIVVSVFLKKGAPAADTTISVAKDAGLFVDDGKLKDKTRPVKRISLAELPLNVTVVVRLSVDRKVAGSIRVEGPRVSGRVNAIDAAKSTITVTISTKGQPDVERTYPVEKGAPVFIYSGKLKFKDKTKPVKGAALKDVPIGARATLRLSLDGKSVIGLQAEGSNVLGTIKAIDAANGTLTLKDKVKGEITYTVSADAVVYLDGNAAARKLADVPVGSFANLKLQADQKSVLEIHVQGPTVMGSVAGTAGNGSITLREKQGDATYTVPAGARISVENKKSGKLTDLIDGTMARLRLSADKSTVLEIHAEGPTYKGRLKSIGQGGKSIIVTVGGKGGVGGDDKEFLLAKLTVIMQESSKTRLKPSDLRADKDVVVRMSIDQKAAVRVTIVGE